ncbi:MAG: hypothetical protein H7A49_15320 [Akkermansiaceae bacterium]|nr:hypothetical protein [Akkermansiaceae bacterium]MCP5545265.1 hypothetical protein [Akkermansiaceae bacterium]
MKTTLTAVLTALAIPCAFAADDHDHDHAGETGHEHEENVTKGPNGGHVIESKAGFSFEVTVSKDRKARIVFLDKKFKPVALGAQTIHGIAGERSAPVKLTFAKGKDKDADVLISGQALPAGAHIPLILTIKPSDEAKAVTERLELHLH